MNCVHQFSPVHVWTCRNKEAVEVTKLHHAGALAWALTKFGVLLDRCSFWLTDSDAADAVELGLLFLHLYNYLAASALQSCKPRWKLRPKMHSFACEAIRRIQDGSRVNPRFVGCCGEEDYIGKIATICKGSVHPSTLARRVLERCMLGLNVHLMSLKAKSKTQC